MRKNPLAYQAAGWTFVLSCLYAASLETVRWWYEPRATWLTVVGGTLLVLIVAEVTASHYNNEINIRAGLAPRMSREQYRDLLLNLFVVAAVPIVLFWQILYLGRWPL